MRTVTCKCGQMVCYLSGMSPSYCVACEECGTTYGGEAVRPHDFSSVSKAMTDEGPKTRTACAMCYRSKWEIENEGK